MVEINLLPAQYRKRTEPNVWRYATLAVPVVAVLGVLTFTVYQTTRLVNIQKDLDAVNGQISALEDQKSEYDALNRQKTDLEKTTQVAQTLQSTKTYWSSDLARFVNALPSGGDVALSSLTIRAVDPSAQTNLAAAGTYNGETVTKEFDLAGQAKSSQALVTFLKSFESNPDFGVDFKSAQRAPDAAPASGSVSAGSSAASGTDGVPYTFNATVGLRGQTTPALGTPGNAAGATSTAPGAPAAPAPAGGSNVR
ncbi:fimbrial assembly protein [Deinococcus sp. KNUC1210]|uniref:fimbrial assembly protein n=1 Tax=Deinococcus sp. KNUC1210 TaxID=2917691 RepID=UPI001EF06289|nr:fimbrial assembly protein [Deinococcus sp. KNUC1210]ULH16671.1 fimbrial assembly protein [Deinococcus sp. KNUC1210]